MAGPDHRPATAEERRWAVVRIVLGTAQVVGAAASVTVLAQAGVNGLSVGLTIATALVMLFSIYLFRVRRYGQRERN